MANKPHPSPTSRRTHRPEPAGRDLGGRGTRGVAALAALLGAASLLAPGCKGGGGGGAGTDAATDASRDALGDAGLPTCPAVDAGVLSASAVQDDFGPNSVAAKMTSALGRVNVYESTNARTLERVEIYLATPLSSSRLTIAIHEAVAMTMPFRKVTDVQIDVPSCIGWASSGPLDVPLVAGRYYAIGFDPNQAVQPYVDSEMDDLPVDGRIGRLVGSKTATSVSVATLTWDKVVATEFTRQRLSTSPRAEPDGGAADAASDGARDIPTSTDAPASDAPITDAAAKDATGTDGAVNDAAVKDAAGDGSTSG